MNDYIHDMFYVPIIHIEVRNWNIKKRRLEDLYENRQNPYGFIWTDFHEQNITYNEVIEDILEEEINEFYSVLNLKGKILNSWFETAEKGNFHPVHQHGVLGYSAVCYVNYCSDYHKPTRFIAPFHNFIDGNNLHYSPNVSEGSLIFFPSMILHYTEPNTSDINRTILSFNLHIDNTYIV